MLKGTIPIVDESYDVTDPVGTGKGVANGAFGFALLLAAVAIGRMVFNRASEQTDSVQSVEVF